MAGKNRIWPYFTFGVVVVAVGILSGIAVALIEWILSAITLILFGMRLGEMLLAPDASLLLVILSLVLAAIFVAVTTIGFVFRKAGFRRK